MFCQCNYAERLKRSQLGLKDAALRHTILARHPDWGLTSPRFYPMSNRSYASDISCPSAVAMGIEPVRISVL